MLEMHKLTRYEYAPVLYFGEGFCAAVDVAVLAAWLQDFEKKKGRPLRRVSFTFHAADEDADSICEFMQLCANHSSIRLVLIQASVELVHAGTMSEAVRTNVNERVATLRF